MDAPRLNYNIKKLVLVVDDEAINREMLGFIVSSEYEVIYAQNGLEAMDQISTHAGTLSMILLDLKMPHMDGFEVMKEVRDNAEYARIPIIVLTAENTQEQEIKCLDYGAVDFIPKPYDHPQVILARIRRNIELAEDKYIIQKAERDELTGLYTRDFFLEYAGHFRQYNKDIPMDCVCININHFHIVNELYGHDGGNRILSVMGEQIRLFLQEHEGYGCRTGADNFFMICPHMEDHAILVNAIRPYESEALEPSNIKVRFGIYPVQDEKETLEQCFDRASLACHTMRNNYTSFLAYYDAVMYEKELYSERLVKDFDTALEENQFRVFFQPKYDITGEKPVLASAEALVRWFHPELGFVSPGAFIPVFEANGLVQRLDLYVWRETARQISRWRDKFGITVPCSVNVSRIDIYNPNLEKDLLQITEEAGLLPEDLHLEVTESAYTDNSRQITAVVENLRCRGFHIEMDDFGSGYSSLNMLTELPMDALKLDMKFIRNMTLSRENLKIVELMIDIAKFLDVDVVAEGVETAEQLDLLKAAGCDIIQGYYFSKPVPPEEFEAFIKEKIG